VTLDLSYDAEAISSRTPPREFIAAIHDDQAIIILLLTFGLLPSTGLLVFNVESGLTNQRIGLVTGLLIARLLKRTVKALE